MSNRFYVNDVQIFGNNEMFKRTYDELKKQGAEWTEDGTFRGIEIKDPQGLMEAVETDIFEYLKEVLTEERYDKEKKEFVEKDFKDVHDKDILLSDFEDELKTDIWNFKSGEQEKYVWRKMCWWIGSKRVFTSYNLYQAIKNDVDFEDGVLKLKEGHTIIAYMY